MSGAVDSNILVDGAAFAPTSFKVVNGTSNQPGEASLVFSLTKGTLNTAGYEALNFTVKYPLTSSSAPNGTYDFGIGEIATTLFANGSYAKGTYTKDSDVDLAVFSHYFDDKDRMENFRMLIF